MDENIDLNELEKLMNNLEEEKTYINVEDELNKEKLKNIIRKNSADSNILAEYIYKGPNGEILYKVQKQKVGERFVVQKYKNGTYEYRLQGVEKVPYNLPQLMASEGKVVFVVNGEDRADLLSQLGFIGTTAPFSSTNKWKPEYNQYLKRAKAVLIIEDNKEKGKKVAESMFYTMQKEVTNLGQVKVLDIANILNIQLPEETDLVDLRNLLRDDERLKSILQELVEEM